jgi:membrane-bound lytic murein transglycosylase MltF
MGVFGLTAGLVLLLASPPLVLAASTPPPPAAPAAPPKRERMGLAMPSQAWTGDLDGMIARRQIRVLVPYSKTFFFVDKGRQRGITHDAFVTLEEELNRKLKTKHLRVSAVFIPTRRDRLLPSLVEGRGDVAAANLTVTEERREMVDFSAPVLTGIDEVVVTGPASPAVSTLEDLGGKEIFVRESSSYRDSLEALNQRLKSEGKLEAILVPAPEKLEDEDFLEMLNAGLIKLVVVDSHKAAFWRQIFPKIVVHPGLAVRTGGSIAWAIRKGSPKFKAELDDFVRTHGEKSAFGRTVLQRYLRDTRFVKEAASDVEMRKFRAVVGLFRKYGDRYGMDWMLMAAQGYQESRLDQGARSHVGAIGVMQVMPQTGKELKVGDINEIEPNIHAGVKYIRFMVDQYYAKEPMDDLNKASSPSPPTTAERGE